MHIIFKADELISSQRTAVTVGTFDGLHLGHRLLFRKLKEVAQREHLRTLIVTFNPHPAEVLKSKNLQLISSIEEKIELFKEQKIDYLLILNFDERLASITYQDFTEKILLDQCKMQHLVLGYDHAFGHARQGNYQNLQTLSKTRKFAVSKVEPYVHNGTLVSSSIIRNLILTGQIETANDLLSHRFALSGKVVEGSKRGRILGFPTANVESLYQHKLIPQTAVYAVQVKCDNEFYFGMANVGFNPTFEGQDKKIEVHIFDFNRSIYEQEITLYFCKRIREEKKFESKEALQEQLKNDETVCRAYFQEKVQED